MDGMERAFNAGMEEEEEEEEVVVEAIDAAVGRGGGMVDVDGAELVSAPASIFSARDSAIDCCCC